ncbi:MAG: hypothetical protein EXQ56_10275 [Acidobacteria bacterium]|nr:hypothetical protein [Acidobacteriota bacterium]
MPRQSLTEYLDESVQYAGDCAIVHRRGYRTERWSYAQLMDSARRFARELEARGVGCGNRVLFWGGNSAEWVAAFWGTLYRGAVVVPMDRAATPEFASTVARQVSAQLLVVDADLSFAFSTAEFAGRTLPFDNFHQMLSRHSADPLPSSSIARADLAQIIFTSGSTAEPKGVALTHGNLLANIEPLEREIAKYRKYERWVHPLRFLEMLPLSHVFGQFMGLFVPQLLGATVIFLDTLNPSEMIRAARRERVSVLVAVPRLLDSMRNKIERDEEASGSAMRFQHDLVAAEQERFWWRWWRFRRIHRQFGWKFWAVLSGGAALSRATETFWGRLGVLVMQGYGLTETASLVSLRHPFGGALGKGEDFIGKSLPGREMILDETGEILVRGENVAAGYWNSEKLQPLTDEQGWFRTGDVGEIDREGNLYFKGRKKNVLVTAAGMNVYPEDIETALRAQPEVRDCVVVGVVVDGAVSGQEEACAALILQAGAGGDKSAAAKIIERANTRLAEYQRLRYWMTWPHDDLPRTSTGKPLLNLIREKLQASVGEARGAEPAGKESLSREASPLDAILRRVAPHSPAADAGISSGTRLEEDLRLTSIDRVELLSEMEDRFQMDVNEVAFSNATTVGELEKLLQRSAAVANSYPYARWPRHWAVAAAREIAWWTLVMPAMLLLGYPRAKGREKLRGVKSPLLVVANHQTEIDAAFLLAALPAQLRRKMAIAMVGERLRDMRQPPLGSNLSHKVFHPIAYFLLTTIFHVLPLPKQSGVRGSFEFMGELVDRGWSIMIFPEGQLTRDGAVGPFRGGIGVLAASLGIPVVPMKIAGLYELRMSGRRRAARGEIVVTMVEPARFGAQDEPEAIAESLRAMVADAGHPSAPS